MAQTDDTSRNDRYSSRITPARLCTAAPASVMGNRGRRHRCGRKTGAVAVSIDPHRHAFPAHAGRAARKRGESLPERWGVRITRGASDHARKANLAAHSTPEARPTQTKKPAVTRGVAAGQSGAVRDSGETSRSKWAAQDSNL